MTKKFINTNVFLRQNYEFKLKSVTRNLVTFKRWDGGKDKGQKFKYYRGSLKNRAGEGGIPKKSNIAIYREDLQI